MDQALKNLAICLLTILAYISTVAQARATESGQTSIGGIRFTLAEGWQIKKIASPELTHWPMIADWDSQGRLVIAESAGVARPIEEHNKQQLHKIIRLVDTDHDGTFDRRVVAIDKIAFPEGVLCLGDDILVAAPPQIWKFSDRDGDGVCEHREIWFDGETITGCANDLHGPYLGRDGWVYWTKGAFAQQEREWLDGRKLKSTAAHIFRRRLEGGQIEPLVSGGMDNPVEVAFLPEGEKLFTSTFLQHPADGLRDGIAHAVYGGVHGKPSDSLNVLSPTGPLMPITIPLGPAAPSGLLTLEATTQPTLVAALFNLQKVTAYELSHHGSTFESIASDLVVADRVDFHPTDVIEDADGSLIVIDTGGWYDLCCPSSRIGQTTAPGGIYRLSKTNSRKIVRSQEPVDFKASNAVEVVEALFDDRPWVRRQASLNLKRFPNQAAGLLSNKTDHVNAIWGLCTIGDAESMRRITNVLQTSQNPLLIQAALHAVSIQRYRPALDDVVRFLQHPEPRIRRVAAEVIGRTGNQQHLPALVRMLDQPDIDRHLEHSIVYALIEISRRESVQPLLEMHALAASEPQRYGLLLALDRLDSTETITSDALFSMVHKFVDNPSSAPLRNAAELATEIFSKQPRRSDTSMVDLDRLWYGLEASPDSAVMLFTVLRGWRARPVTKEWIAKRFVDSVTLTDQQTSFMGQHLDRLFVGGVPSDLHPDLIRWFEQANGPQQVLIAETLARLEMSDQDRDAINKVMIAAMLDADDPLNQLKLLSSCPVIEPLNLPGGARDFAKIEATVIHSLASDDRTLCQAAGRGLLKLRLSKKTTIDLLALLPKLSTDGLQSAIQSLYSTYDTASRTQLFNRLRSEPIAKTLPVGFLTNLTSGDAPEIRELAKEVMIELSRSPADLEATVQTMLTSLPPGDAVRGLQVFRSQKAACSSCHQLGYVGGLVGPDLTRIGASRTSEAMLEAIVAPSARIEQSYRSVQILTVDGRVLNGLVEARDGDSIKLRTGAETLETIDLDDIELEQPSDISVMPAGLADQLSAQEMADLMQLLRMAR